jgi:putative membrane protein
VPEVPPVTPWQRLDPRMLLVHPITELVKFLPVLIGLLIAGGASGTGPWALLGVGVPVGLGVVRYLTTTYRVSDARVELKRGLLQRHTLSTPLDRVRTVDLTSSLIHRVLGLATVVIGTGSVATDSDERLELDALPREHATALREHLLGRRAGVVGGPLGDPEAETVVVRFTPRWLWYAPFSGTVLVAAGAVAAVVGQLAEFIDIRITEDDIAGIGPGFVLALSLTALVLAVVLALAGYLVTNAGFTLARQGAAWHVRRGLLTHRETSIDVTRLAGVSVGEPAALRLARGRKVGAIVTGLGADRAGSAVLLPPAPARTATDVVRSVLGTAAPGAGPLLRHGRAATTRRFTRALLGAGLVVVPVCAGLALGGPAWLAAVAVGALVVALALATDRARALGHAHLDGHVVTRSGSLLRRRDALASEHVIGWNLRATWFQRRAGLVSVAATTAGGTGRVAVDDVPETAALRLAAAATPGLVDQFVDQLVDVTTAELVR